MKTVLTTYLDSEEAKRIDREARRLELSLSSYIAEIISNPFARSRVQKRLARAKRAAEGTFGRCAAARAARDGKLVAA